MGDFLKFFLDFFSFIPSAWNWLFTPNASLFNMAPIYMILGAGILVGIVWAIVDII